MMDNISIGPITCFKDESEIITQCRDLFYQGYFALCVVNKGETFDDIKKQLVKEDQPKLKGIIISFYYLKFYLA